MSKVRQHVPNVPIAVVVLFGRQDPSSPAILPCEATKNYPSVWTALTRFSGAGAWSFWVGHFSSGNRHRPCAVHDGSVVTIEREHSADVGEHRGVSEIGHQYC
jgi:hypothetical protein